MKHKPIATGFSFGPLPDGNVLIEFHDGGEIINSQIISGDAFRRIPMVVHLTQAVVDGDGRLLGADLGAESRVE